VGFVARLGQDRNAYRILKGKEDRKRDHESSIALHVR
jgi:hypothetical protein